MKKKIASVLATAAAVAFSMAPITSSIALADHGSNMAPCYGVNGCKGKSECKTAANTCKGENGCKGKGVLMMTAKKCKKSGGSTDEPKG